MNQTESNNGLDAKKIQDLVCIICLQSFGVYDQRIPYQCTQKECGRNYCGSCINTIKTCNGPDRPFQCMFCLFKYQLNMTPVKNQSLLDALWERASIKYGFQQRCNNSGPTIMSQEDFQFEWECRYYHLTFLLGTLEQFKNWVQVKSAFKTRNDAYGMIDQLRNILDQIKANPPVNVQTCQNEYNQRITLPNQSRGSFYIDLCERLSFEVVDAEFRFTFPKTNAKSIEWNCTLGSGDRFQPKINELMKTIQDDVNSLGLHAYHLSLRTRIGFIGYTSTGKTTLMCRLLGMDGSQHGVFLPVHTTKSTYYPLQYDRKNPLIHPDDPNITTPAKFIDIQGADQGFNISSSTFEPGNYLDEIYKADCDIYVLVFSHDLTNEQHRWIVFIEQWMHRQCILVRSKIDEAFLNKFVEQHKVYYAMSPVEKRPQWSSDTINALRSHFQIDGYQVFLTAANYRPNSSDNALLLQNQTFDFQLLLNELGRRASLTRNLRLRNLAVRAMQRVINSCFRSGYVLNIMKYKIVAAMATPILFGGLIPRYAAQDRIREAFGITVDLLQSLKQRNLQLLDGQLQTSVFKPYVKISTGKQLYSRQNLTGTHVALGVATFGVGLVLSAAARALLVSDTGKDIFSHLNQLCDDLILLSIPLVESFMEDRPSAPIA